MLCQMRLLEISWMGCQKVLSLSSLRFSSWKVLCIVQSKLQLPTLGAAKQHSTKSFTPFQKPLAFTTPYLLVTIGIFQVDELTTVGTVMVTMESTNASFPKIKLGLRQTRRNGRKKRRRSLDLSVIVLALEENTMRGPSLVAEVVLKSHQEVVLKNSTMFGTCIATRVVGGTVPIPLAFTLPSLQIRLLFLLLYLLPIPTISKLLRSNARTFLHHLLPFLLLPIHLLVRTLSA